jgi:hypothetical protein
MQLKEAAISLDRVLERIATSDRLTIVVEGPFDSKLRATSNMLRGHRPGRH